jgi:hypothetical protein
MADRTSLSRPRDGAIAPDGRARAVIETITPAIDGGRFAVKRIAGDRVEVEADCFTDGHDSLACIVRYRREEETAWQEARWFPRQRPLAGHPCRAGRTATP